MLMTTASAPAKQPIPVIDTDWRQQLRDAIRQPDELLRELGLEHSADFAALAKAHSLFRTLVPQAFLQRMQPGNTNDPLLRQVLPSPQEHQITAGFSSDPVADNAHSPVPGIIHKYHGRVLLITTGSCAVNCRYCFRREFNYADQQITGSRWQQCLNYIATNTDITEVIFSGGDPLIISTAKLQAMTNALQQLEHLKRLRLHTRLPIVIPDRVTPELIEWITALKLPLTLVLHINHANEIDSALAHRCQQLREAGCILLNQSVLLKDVNDNTASLVALSETLFNTGILPYYLNLLDRVNGAAHFLINDKTAKAIHVEMRQLLPGYLVPRLVRDDGSSISKLQM